MKKIKSLFVRNYDGDRLVIDQVVEGCEWVIAGEGTPTVKFDGTCCLVKNGILYKRYDAKLGKVPPEGFIAAQELDEKTGHWPGWLKVMHGPEDQHHREAFKTIPAKWVDVQGNELPILEEGTYELLGPKIQGNPEKYEVHKLVKHGSVIIDDNPRDYESIKEYLRTHNMEGIVWHHPDGRMVKIKARDFGLERNKNG